MPPNTPSNLRTRRSKSGSISSTFTAQSSDSVPDPAVGSTPLTANNSNDEAPVGLSDLSNSGSRKAMLQLINRLRDTGYDILSSQLPCSVHDVFPAEYKPKLTCL